MPDADPIPAFLVLGFQVGVGRGEVGVKLELISATGDTTQQFMIALLPKTAGELGKQLGEAAAAAIGSTPASFRQ